MTFTQFVYIQNASLLHCCITITNFLDILYKFIQFSLLIQWNNLTTWLGWISQLEMTIIYQNNLSSLSSSRRSELRSFGGPRNMPQRDEITRLLLHLHREPIFMHFFPARHFRYRQQFCGRASTSNTTCSTIRLINTYAAFLVFCMAMNSTNCKK